MKRPQTVILICEYFYQNPAIGFFWYIRKKNHIIKELLISKAGFSFSRKNSMVSGISNG